MTASSLKIKTLVPVTKLGRSEGGSLLSGSPGSTGTQRGGSRCGASSSYKLHQKEQGTGRVGFDGSLDSCEAVGASIRKAELTEEVIMADGSPSSPRHHLPPSTTRLKLSSSEKPNPTLSNQGNAPSCLRSTDKTNGKWTRLVVWEEIESWFQHPPACPVAGFPV